MNAIELLTNQHREVEALFKKIESGKGDKKQLFQDIQQRLELHTQLEEKFFYPEGEQVEEELALEAYEEHDLVKTLLKKMAKSEAEGPEFMAQVSVLKELVQHHVEEEEAELFPACEREFGEEKLMEIGDKMLAEQEKIAGRMEGKSGQKKIQTRGLACK